MEKASDLGARYGGRQRLRGDLIAGCILAAAIVGVVLYFIITAIQPAQQIKTRDLEFNLDTPGVAELRYEVSTVPGQTVACAVNALSEKHAVVGLKVIEHEATPAPTTVHSAKIRIIAPATTVTVDKCWAVQK